MKLFDNFKFVMLEIICSTFLNFQTVISEIYHDFNDTIPHNFYQF